MSETNRALARAAAGMGAATAISRAFGFVRVLVVAAVLGTTYLGNSFQAANSVSNVLFELLAAGALSAVLVPTFVGLLDRGDDEEARRVAAGLLAVALGTLGVVTVVGIAGAPLIARLLATGVPDPAVASEQRQLLTFLLWFFVPQVLLYAYGAVATAWLYARRRFAVTAAAPIGNTIVMVGALAVFRVLAGPEPGLDLTTGERALLVAGGSGGVAAFVGVLVLAAARRGFPLRPRLVRGDARMGEVLRLAGWGILLHANAGILLGAALVLGNAVAGGVVAYQVAFVFFLAPYAVLAQPVHTAILPELSTRSLERDDAGFAATVRWGLDRVVVLVVPVSAALVALALPAMDAVAFGRAAGDGAALLAAGLATLAAGLLPYGAFLMLARAFYALGDARTPAVVAIVSAAVGVVVMAAGASWTHGAARVAALGIGHSAAYALGAVALAVALGRRLGHRVAAPALPRVAAVSAVLGVPAWIATRAVAPDGRLESVGWLVVVGALGAAGYVVGLRRARLAG